MEKNCYYFNFNKQNKILASSVLDRYEMYRRYGKSTYTNFLNPVELYFVTSYLNHYHISYSIYELPSFMEKKIIYFGDYEEFLTFYKISSNGFSPLTHSELLGSLFKIGFQESTIGDIFVKNGVCYYTNLTRLNDYLEQNLVRVGKQSVTLEKIEFFNFPERQFDEFTVLTSSMRVDSVVSKISSQSRNQVRQMFLDKKVLLNYQELTNDHAILKEDDILSIRKFGKFRIGKQQGLTKKGNIILEVYQYK